MARENLREGFKIVVWLIIIIAVAAVLGRMFLFKLARTNSYSMVPNLFPGDYFLVYTRATMGLGDIAVCRDPDDPRVMTIGRIVGVPGSKLAMKNNRLVVNGRRVEQQFPGPGVMYVDNTAGEYEELHVGIAEEMLGGRLYSVALLKDGLISDVESRAVEEGFFLIADNRNRARDSRDYDEVPISDCIGLVTVILWPGPDSGDFKQLNRILEWVD